MLPRLIQPARLSIASSRSYGAVVRGANAYVPPGARKAGGGAPTAAAAAKPEIPKVSVNGPDGSTAKDTQKPASPAPTSTAKVRLRLRHVCAKFIDLLILDPPVNR